MAKPKEAETPDEILVVAAIIGDLAAFDELARRYRAAVLRVAQGIVGYEDAEDVAQDALLLAFKALPSIEDPQKFAAWLSTITRHRAFRFNERERSQKVVHVELDEMLLEEIGALTAPFDEESCIDEEIEVALENIPADYALAVRLRFLDEMPLKRIAAFLNLPLTTVKWRVHRGKELLRAEIERLRERGTEWKAIKNS